MAIEFAFIIGLAVLLLLAIKFKVNAFVSLLISALTIGILSGMNLPEVIKTMTGGFGKTVSSIGIVIIFGVMLGKYLEDSRGAEKMARTLAKAVGEKRSPMAMALSGYLISIPVFSDVGYVILSPLAKAISRTSKVSFYAIAVSLSAGLLATHVFVPPTPGPLAVAGLLGVDVGEMIIWGGLAALGMTLAGWLWAVTVMPKIAGTYIPEADADETEETSQEMPGGLVSFLPLLIPMILILSATTSKMVLPKGHSFITFTSFIGDANIAMAVGVIFAICLLGRKLKKTGEKNPILKIMDDALKSAGPIIFITAAGGALGAILKSSGAGKAIAEAVANSGMPFILVPFFIAGILKTIQGSGTVAVVTAATLCLPIAQQLGLHPILIALASGSGARLICHVNDSYFWVYTNMSGFDTKTGLKTLSAANVAMALGGLAVTFIASIVL